MQQVRSRSAPRINFPARLWGSLLLYKYWKVCSAKLGFFVLWLMRMFTLNEEAPITLLPLTMSWTARPGGGTRSSKT